MNLELVFKYQSHAKKMRFQSQNWILFETLKTFGIKFNLFQMQRLKNLTEDFFPFLGKY